MKYVYMATSANFGNMFSMAVISLFLPFLPLLPKQVLLTNLLTDLPEMAIATDAVDADLVARPGRWSVPFISRFMLAFGSISAIFDFVTFGVLLFILHANEQQFRTGWYMESVASASLIVLVIRTRKSILKSFPSRPLILATLACLTLTLLIPLSPLASMFGFEPLPLLFFLLLGGVLLAYVGTAELTKKLFYQHEGNKLL